MAKFKLELKRAKSAPDRTSRRKFLTGAGLAGAAAVATVAMPNVSRAETATFRFQSTWPAKDIFHEYAQDYAKKANDLAGGRLKLEVLPAGAVVGALQMQDAVQAGALDGGHGVCAYWYGKHKAYSLFGTPPSFGWEANTMLGWIRYGGGQQLYDELVGEILKLNLVGFLCGPMPNQPLGWFKKEVKGPEDLKNLKYRTVGLAADLMKEVGAAVTIMGGGDIVPAMDRGVLDAAEFNNPSSDRALGFPDVSKVYMLRSYHQAMECFEVIFNKTKFNALPAELQLVLKYAAEAASSDMSWKAMDRYSTDLAEMQAKQNVKVFTTPQSVLDAQLAAWDKVIAAQSAEPFFAKVIASQKTWAKRVVGFQLLNTPSSEAAYNHFFKTA
ncbi:MAG: twin-arginine translocation signal domain-containing protein [Azospirillum sp.]|nr:twin-arginine translocation signal domain-containing protein [Azospirillum sp.]